MIVEILNDDGEVINRIVADAEFCDAVHKGRWREALPDKPAEPTLDEVKAVKIAEIKAEADRRITALDWRLQRAQEREQLGETGVETVADVLALREQIRQASNAAELAVATLASVEDVQAFTW